MPERWVFIHPFQLRVQRGIESYIWNLSVALARAGIQVDLLTWAGPLDIPESVHRAGVRVYQVPAVRYFQAQFAIGFYVYWLLKGRYQHGFVHFAGYGEGAALRILHLLHRALPFSVVFHFPLSLVPHRYREFARWGFQRHAQHLIAVSRATAHEADGWAGRTCAVIEHGVDTDHFAPSAALRTQMRQTIAPSATLLLSVAALEERKGMQWVIRAMPELLKQIPNLHYWIVGDGPYREALARLVAALALEQHVHFWGAKLDVRPFLCAADIMMVLAQGEASSISLLEAMACGLPAITSARPPFDELTHDAWGIKVDEEDVQQVVSAVLRLASNSNSNNEANEAGTQMGEAARAWVMEHHHWAQAASKYQHLIGGAC